MIMLLPLGSATKRRFPLSVCFHTIDKCQYLENCESWTKNVYRTLMANRGQMLTAFSAERKQLKTEIQTKTLRTYETPAEQ